MFLMRLFARPKIVISKCIEFDHCRSDGGQITSDFVNSLEVYMDFIPVCHEVEIGLGVPRSSFRIVSSNGEPRLIQLKYRSGRDRKDKDLLDSVLEFFIG